MKRLLTSRILACLIFLTIWGSKTYAQGSISSYTAGTETFKITSNTSIPKQNTEYQYYASANISLFIGADEVWENTKLIGGKYYLHSQGGPGILPDGSSNKNQKDAGYYEAKILRVTQLVSPCQTQVTIFIFCSTPKVKSNLPLM